MLYVLQNKYNNLCCYIFESLIHVILHKQENIIKLDQTFKMSYVKVDRHVDEKV